MLKVLHLLLFATLPSPGHDTVSAAAEYIDRAHPEVLRMQRLSKPSPAQTGSVATRIHRLVRGGAKFGWTSSFQHGAAVSGGEGSGLPRCAKPCGGVALDSTRD